MSEKRKRRFRFSLRAMLVVMLLLGCVMVPFVSRLRESRRQSAAVALVIKGGGSVYYDYEFDESGGVKSDADTQPTGPRWLRRQLGDDFFCRVKWVQFLGDTYDGKRYYHCTFSDMDLKQLEVLTSLERMALCDTQITDEGLASLEHMTNLEELALSGTHVTDEGLEHLVGLKDLQWLCLIDTRVTDRGVKRLQKRLPECFIQTEPTGSIIPVVP